MATYKGTIIEESLETKDVLKKMKNVSTKVEPITDKHQTPWLKQWTLHAVEIPESEARTIAEAIAQSLDREHGASWYADFKSDTHHYIIFRDKVFFIDRKSKEQYNEAKRYGLSLGVPEYQLINYQGIAIDDLTQFLKEANRSTYANKDAPKTASSRLESEDYHFEKDDLIYHDTYFGGRDFIGEEIVYKEGTPVWGANYFGFILTDVVGEKEVYDFLRQALMEDNDEAIPLRGASNFTKGDWDYRFSATGKLGNFSGQEEISLKGKAVYRCLVHGGFIR